MVSVNRQVIKIGFIMVEHTADQESMSNIDNRSRKMRVEKWKTGDVLLHQDCDTDELRIQCFLDGELVLFVSTTGSSVRKTRPRV